MKSIITRLLLVLMAGLAAVQTASADISEKYTLSFSENDFSLTTDANGLLYISPNGISAIYPSGDTPGLPQLSKDIAVRKNMRYKSLSVKFNKRLIRSNVTVARTPARVSTDTEPTAISADTPSHIVGVTTVYPKENCQFAAQSKWSNVGIVHFLTCPFVYNKVEKNLYFIDSMELTVVYDMLSSSSIDNSYSIDPSILKDIVLNPDRLQDIFYNGTVHASRLDYLVITGNSLKSSFEPLVAWKKTKGLHSAIKTIEEIESEYSGSDIQEKIKACLSDLYKNRGLKYVLLGGDDTVVPVRGCHSIVEDTDDGEIEDIMIPADIYYACFGGEFNWDGNGNGMYGEPDDGIDLAQSIFVTRVPVRTAQHVSAYVNKLLAYEKNPVWNNNMLLCGNALDSFYSANSDASIMGETLRNYYIKPAWNGDVIRFFDTCTDFPEEEKHDLTASNLRKELSKGYSFVDMITHGTQDLWNLEKDKFTTWNVRTISSQGYTIITTMSCNTNAFDTSSMDSDPCLSEAFIRHQGCGVIAYLGCSRRGWYYLYPSSPNLRIPLCGPSMEYEMKFYGNLFSPNTSDRSFGALVALAKTAMISASSKDGEYRWVQFGLNPVGDPEMPVFTETPKAFEDLKFTYSGGKLTLDTGVEGCRICVMSSDDNGASCYRVFEDVSTISMADLPLNGTICVTKQGHIPAVKTLKVLQNTRLTTTSEYDCDIMLVGSAMTTRKAQGPVIIEKGKCGINAGHVFLGKGIQVKKGAEMKVTNTQANQ